MQFSYKIEGLDELIANSKRAGSVLPSLLMQAMVKSTTLVQNDAKRTGPGRFKNRTGNLRRSIQKTMVTPARGEVEAGEPYGVFVEGGTRAHAIYPHGKYLRFQAANGKVVFARKVNHPGSKPYPFMEPALQENIPNIVSIYGELTDKVIKELAR